MVIENFAVLSAEEQINFAETLLEKLNSEKMFTDETNFVFEEVEHNDVTGGLWVSVSLANPISVKREATWEAGDEDGAYEDPGRDAEYSSTIEDDAKKSFKTLTAAVDGYNVSLQIDDIDEDESVDAEVEVESISNEDSGIGSYEYFGLTGYDSQPYVAVTGTITRYCDCAITFYIEPADEI
jgi:hypothetical protein